MKSILAILMVIVTSSLVFSGEVDEKLHLQCLYPTITTISGTETGTAFIVRSEKYTDNYYKNVFIGCAHAFPENVTQHFVKVPMYKNWSKVEGYTTYKASIYIIDRDLDISIGLFATTEKQYCGKVNWKDNVYFGNDVFKIGYGLGEDARLDHGKITAVGDRLRLSAFTVPGDSGGPVFDSNYQMIGVIKSIKTMIDNEQTRMACNIAQAVPVRKINNLDNRINKDIRFVFDERAKIPEIPFYNLYFSNWESSLDFIPGMDDSQEVTNEKF